MKKLLFIVFTLFFLSSWMVLLPDQAEEALAKKKVQYLYSFTKYIEWPAESKQGNFTIGVVGSNPAIASELNKLVTVINGKAETTQKLEILNIGSNTDPSKCHIVYILPESSSELKDIVTKVKSKNTLIVTESRGLMAQGSAINFYFVESKLNFELSKSNIVSHNLKVANTLESLAKNQ
jgi:YfiR/HmsC-like